MAVDPTLQDETRTALLDAAGIAAGFFTSYTGGENVQFEPFWLTDPWGYNNAGARYLFANETRINALTTLISGFAGEEDPQPGRVRLGETPLYLVTELDEQASRMRFLLELSGDLALSADVTLSGSLRVPLCSTYIGWGEADPQPLLDGAVAVEVDAVLRHEDGGFSVSDGAHSVTLQGVGITGTEDSFAVRLIGVDFGSGQAQDLSSDAAGDLAVEARRLAVGILSEALGGVLAVAGLDPALVPSAEALALLLEGRRAGLDLWLTRLVDEALEEALSALCALLLGELPAAVAWDDEADVWRATLAPLGALPDLTTALCARVVASAGRRELWLGVRVGWASGDNTVALDAWALSLPLTGDGAPRGLPSASVRLIHDAALAGTDLSIAGAELGVEVREVLSDGVAAGHTVVPIFKLRDVAFTDESPDRVRELVRLTDALESIGDGLEDALLDRLEELLGDAALSDSARRLGMLIGLVAPPSEPPLPEVRHWLLGPAAALARYWFDLIDHKVVNDVAVAGAEIPTLDEDGVAVDANGDPVDPPAMAEVLAEALLPLLFPLGLDGADAEQALEVATVAGSGIEADPWLVPLFADNLAPALTLYREARGDGYGVVVGLRSIAAQRTVSSSRAVWAVLSATLFDVDLPADPEAVAVRAPLSGRVDLVYGEGLTASMGPLEASAERATASLSWSPEQGIRLELALLSPRVAWGRVPYENYFDLTGDIWATPERIAQTGLVPEYGDDPLDEDDVSGFSVPLDDLRIAVGADGVSVDASLSPILLRLASVVAGAHLEHRGGSLGMGLSALLGLAADPTGLDLQGESARRWIALLHDLTWPEGDPTRMLPGRLSLANGFFGLPVDWPGFLQQGDAVSLDAWLEDPLPFLFDHLGTLVAASSVTGAPHGVTATRWLASLLRAEAPDLTRPDLGWSISGHTVAWPERVAVSGLGTAAVPWSAPLDSGAVSLLTWVTPDGPRPRLDGQAWLPGGAVDLAWASAPIGAQRALALASDDAEEARRHVDALTWEEIAQAVATLAPATPAAAAVEALGIDGLAAAFSALETWLTETDGMATQASQVGVGFQVEVLTDTDVLSARAHPTAVWAVNALKGGVVPAPALFIVLPGEDEDVWADHDLDGDMGTLSLREAGVPVAQIDLSEVPTDLLRYRVLLRAGEGDDPLADLFTQLIAAVGHFNGAAVTLVGHGLGARLATHFAYIAPVNVGGVLAIASPHWGTGLMAQLAGPGGDAVRVIEAMGGLWEADTHALTEEDLPETSALGDLIHWLYTLAEDARDSAPDRPHDERTLFGLLNAGAPLPVAGATMVLDFPCGPAVADLRASVLAMLEGLRRRLGEDHAFERAEPTGAGVGLSLHPPGLAPGADGVAVDWRVRADLAGLGGVTVTSGVTLEVTISRPGAWLVGDAAASARLRSLRASFTQGADGWSVAATLHDPCFDGASAATLTLQTGDDAPSPLFEAAVGALGPALDAAEYGGALSALKDVVSAAGLLDVNWRIDLGMLRALIDTPRETLSGWFGADATLGSLQWNLSAAMGLTDGDLGPETDLPLQTWLDQDGTLGLSLTGLPLRAVDADELFGQTTLDLTLTMTADGVGVAQGQLAHVNLPGPFEAIQLTFSAGPEPSAVLSLPGLADTPVDGLSETLELWGADADRVEPLRALIGRLLASSSVSWGLEELLSVLDPAGDLVWLLGLARRFEVEGEQRVGLGFLDGLFLDPVGTVVAAVERSTDASITGFAPLVVELTQAFFGALLELETEHTAYTSVQVGEDEGVLVEVRDASPHKLTVRLGTEGAADEALPARLHVALHVDDVYMLEGQGAPDDPDRFVTTATATASFYVDLSDAAGGLSWVVVNVSADSAGVVRLWVDYEETDTTTGTMNILPGGPEWMDLVDLITVGGTSLLGEVVRRATEAGTTLPGGAAWATFLQAEGLWYDGGNSAAVSQQWRAWAVNTAGLLAASLRYGRLGALLTAVAEGATGLVSDPDDDMATLTAGGWTVTLRIGATTSSTWVLSVGRAEAGAELTVGVEDGGTANLANEIYHTAALAPSVAATLGGAVLGPLGEALGLSLGLGFEDDLALTVGLPGGGAITLLPDVSLSGDAGPILGALALRTAVALGHDVLSLPLLPGGAMTAGGALEALGLLDFDGVDAWTVEDPLPAPADLLGELPCVALRALSEVAAGFAFGPLTVSPLGGEDLSGDYGVTLALDGELALVEGADDDLVATVSLVEHPVLLEEGESAGVALILLHEDANGDCAPALALSVRGLALGLARADGSPLLEIGGARLGAMRLITRMDVDLADPLNISVDAGGALELLDLGLPLGEIFAGGDTDPVAVALLSEGVSDQGSVSPGFDLYVGAWNDGLEVGLGDWGVPERWFNVRRDFGPLYIQQVGVAADSDAVSLKVDGRVDIGALRISLDDLTLTAALTDLLDPLSWSLSLVGLGINYSADAVTLSGALRNHDGDYQGLCQLRAAGWTVSALGAFSAMDNGEVSLFVFGAMPLALGGPGIYSVEGLAGGFGYNRDLTVPEVGDVDEFPLIEVASTVDEPADPITVLNRIDETMPVRRGHHWAAFGVQGVSYELIHSNLLAYVRWGSGVEIGIVGTASAELPEDAPIAHLAMNLAAKVDVPNEVISLRAQLTDDSWLFAENQVQLTGGFALVYWYGRGDFVFTVGGYHPAFRKPSYYPDVPRLGFLWEVDRRTTIKGGTYFALTSSAVMTGGSIEASHRRSWLRASAGATVDILVSWDPFYYDFSIGAWLEGEIKLPILGWVGGGVGAKLRIYGPPLRGRIKVRWHMIEVSFSFGAAERRQIQAKSFDTFFLENVMGAGATEDVGDVAADGLIQPRVLQGQVNDPGAWVGAYDASADPNIEREKEWSPDRPVQLTARALLEVRTRLPATRVVFGAGQAPVPKLTQGSYGDHLWWDGARSDGIGIRLDARPCQLEDIASTLRLVLKYRATAGDDWDDDEPERLVLTPIVENVPGALWLFEGVDGNGAPQADADATFTAAIVGVELRAEPSFDEPKGIFDANNFRRPDTGAVDASGVFAAARRATRPALPDLPLAAPEPPAAVAARALRVPRSSALPPRGHLSLPLPHDRRVVARIEGAQHARLAFLGRSGRLLRQVVVPPGAVTLDAPPGAARLVATGLGARAPEAVGFRSGSVLRAGGPLTWLGHGVAVELVRAWAPAGAADHRRLAAALLADQPVVRLSFAGEPDTLTLAFRGPGGRPALPTDLSLPLGRLRAPLRTAQEGDLQLLILPVTPVAGEVRLAMTLPQGVTLRAAVSGEATSALPLAPRGGGRSTLHLLDLEPLAPARALAPLGGLR
ncbi:MAG: hypothetical protein H6739_35140 [Alphaproteobacteria bacterium]|nr:hypothetical protein [Alphaproteobacteria bacterium]